jgi:hypothetical protein
MISLGDTLCAGGGERMTEENTMTLRRIVQLCFVLLAGVVSFAVTLFGIASAMAVDMHFNPLLSILYWFLPIISLPVFLLGFVLRKLVAFQAILAIAYLAVYSALNWRTCTSLGYCGSIASTVLMTLRTHSVLAFFAVAVFSFAAMGLDASRPIGARVRE